MPGVSEIFGRVRGYLVRALRRTTAIWAGAAGLAVLVLAWLLAGAEGWSPGTPGPLLLDTGLLVVAVGAVWGLRRLSRRWLSERRIAGSMEAAAGMGQGTVLGALEIGRDLPPGVSGSLARVAERGVARGLDLPDEALAGPLDGEVSRWSRRGLAALGTLASVALILLALTPGRTLSAWAGLGTPFRLLAQPVLPPLEVSPGDAEVLRGEELEVRVEAPGRGRVTLHWQAAGDVARTADAAVRDGRARFTVPDVRAPLGYHVQAPDGARSGRYRVTPVDPLLVSDVTVELLFPAYTGRVPEEHRGDVPPLSVPVGTRLRIEGRASRSLSVARLVAEGEAEGAPAVELAVEGPLFRATWRPDRSGTYRWVFTDLEGGGAEVAPTPLDVTLVPDSVPDVRITFPGRDTVLPLSQRQPLVMEARDDHGVRTLELVAYRVTSLGERQDPRVRAVELGANRGVLARPVLDVSGWGLLPGDTVRYFARAVDNGPAAQTATTPEYVLRVPGAAEMRRDAQRRLDDAAGDVEELAERAAESARETRELERRTSSAGNREAGSPSDPGRQPGPEEAPSFEEREGVRQALDRQSELQAAVDSVRNELREMAEAMENAGVSDPELDRDLRELQELLEEALTPEMRESLRRMLEEPEEMGRTRTSEALEDLRAQQEEMRQRLDESLERFRRAAVEQDFRATTEEAEELAREEGALAEAMREDEDVRDRADQQDELRERAEEMDERMERLEERLRELGEEDAAREVRGARERSAEARRSMDEASRQARQQNAQQAGERAEEASRQMSETAGQLEEARQQQAREQAEAVERALRQAADDALSLARRQAELGAEMGDAGRERLAEVRADVAAVEQGVRNVAENLQAGGASQGGADRALSTLLGEAMQALERTVEAMEGRAGPTPAPSRASEEAVAALNDVAMAALAGAEQASQEGQQGQGQADMQQMMESLAQQQGQLNNQAGQIMPMQLGPQAMQSQMEQLSQGQQSVADELGQLANEPGSDEALGDLQALAREAEELARELAGGRLEAPTRERQERLFHRLLDAGRSLEKDEYSEEREARAPGDVERGEVQPLGEEALDAVLFRLPGAAALQRLSPAERRLVIQYFERLNREARGSGSGAPSGNPPEPAGGGGAP